MSARPDNLARFLSIVAILVSGVTAYMTYEANVAAYTHQIKAEFANKWGQTRIF